MARRNAPPAAAPPTITAASDGDASDAAPRGRALGRRVRQMSPAMIDRVAREYMRLGSGWRAVRAAVPGASPDMAARIWQAVDERVMQRVAALRQADAEEWAAHRGAVLQRIAGMIFADPAPILCGDPPETWPAELRAAVQAMRIRRDGSIEQVTLADRVGAARALAQASGWLSHDVSVHVSAMIGLGDRLAAARARIAGGDAAGSAQMSADTDRSAQLLPVPDTADQAQRPSD